MGQRRTLKPPRVVLDTNCVVSALLFAGGSLAWLRDGWQQEAFLPLVSRETVEELIRVMAYPKFRLNPEEQDALLADFVPYVVTVPNVSSARDVVAVRDPSDGMFLDLAVSGKAEALVTGDGDLHAVGSEIGIPILSPGNFAGWLRRR